MRRIFYFGIVLAIFTQCSSAKCPELDYVIPYVSDQVKAKMSPDKKSPWMFGFEGEDGAFYEIIGGKNAGHKFDGIIDVDQDDPEKWLRVDSVISYVLAHPELVQARKTSENEQSIERGEESVEGNEKVCLYNLLSDGEMILSIQRWINLSKEKKLQKSENVIMEHGADKQTEKEFAWDMPLSEVDDESRRNKIHETIARARTILPEEKWKEFKGSLKGFSDKWATALAKKMHAFRVAGLNEVVSLVHDKAKNLGVQ